MAPTTGFEDSNGASWTTLANEQTFLETIAAETSATLTNAGDSVEDRPIWRLDLGSGTAKTWYINSLVHANEPASREAVLIWMRDLAYSTDQAIIDYLAAHRIVAVPTANPDGVANDTRHNANGVDINRDGFALSQPETRALMSIVTEIQPQIVTDIHERISTDPGINIQFRRPEIIAVYSGLRDKADDLIAHIGLDLDAASISHDLYPNPGRPSWREYGGLHHAVSLLTETIRADDPLDRVTYDLAAFESIRAFHAAEAASIATVVAASRTFQTSTSDAYILQTGSTQMELPWPEVVLPGHLAGYGLDGSLSQDVIDAWAIDVVSGQVPLSQEARAVIPILLDSESDDQLNNATQLLESVKMWEDITEPGGQVITAATQFNIPEDRYDRIRVVARGQMSGPGTMTMRVNGNAFSIYESAWVRLDTSAGTIPDNNDFDGTSWVIGKWNGATWCMLDLEMATTSVDGELGFMGRSIESGAAGNRSITLTSGNLSADILLNSVTLGGAIGSTFTSARVWIEGHLAS